MSLDSYQNSWHFFSYTEYYVSDVSDSFWRLRSLLLILSEGPWNMRLGGATCFRKNSCSNSRTILFVYGLSKPRDLQLKPGKNEFIVFFWFLPFPLLPLQIRNIFCSVVLSVQYLGVFLAYLCLFYASLQLCASSRYRCLIPILRAFSSNFKTKSIVYNIYTRFILLYATTTSRLIAVFCVMIVPPQASKHGLQRNVTFFSKPVTPNQLKQCFWMWKYSERFQTLSSSLCCFFCITWFYFPITDNIHDSIVTIPWHSNDQKYTFDFHDICHYNVNSNCHSYHYIFYTIHWASHVHK